MKKIILLSTVASAMVMAAAYKIPEQSLNSMALGAAYVAHTTDADTAYYNPANMSFLDPDVRYFETGITLAHLPPNKFVGMDIHVGPADGESETENIPIPYMHYVAPAMGKWRYGVSLTAPAGLTKRWESSSQKFFAEEFTLKNLELNPVLSYRVSDTFSIAGGLRAIYSEGLVKLAASPLPTPAVKMEGDTVEFGYNLAATYRPTPDVNLAVTYRSKVDLKEEGTATIGGNPMDASVTLPIPAALNIAISKTWDDKITLEFVYERTFWSAYKTLEFVGTPLPVKDKSWEDTNSFRLGLTYQYSDRLTLMAGYSYDATPVPARTLSYELPDSDAHIFSAGFKYQQTENLSWGVAVLYDYKVSRTLNPGENENGIIGEFSDGGAVLMTAGLSYKF